MALDLALVLPFLFVGALLYSSVGHGGATVYLAIFTLAGYAINPLVTTVLVLNVLAAGIGFWRFTHAGHLRPRILWPFLVTSVPLAFVGGLVPLPSVVRGQILGVLLLVAAVRFLVIPVVRGPERAFGGVSMYVVAPLVGAALGFAAGATGIGGGIFLSPLLVLFRWANVKQAGAVAAIFIVVNSLAGLAARVGRVPIAWDVLLPTAFVVVVGAVVGSWLGAVRVPKAALGNLLGIVLLVAGVKALLG